jgi:MFS family permease
VGIGIIAPLMPVYAQEMGASGFDLGVIFAAFAASRMIFTPLVGRFSDRFGRKWFLLGGLILFTMLSLGYIGATSVLHLTLLRFAHGATSALVIPIAFAYIGDITPEKEEGRYMSLVNLAIFVGMGIGPLMGGKLADAYGLRSAFVALFATGAFAAALVLVLLPDLRAGKAARDSKLPPMREILSNRLVKGLLTIRAGSAVRRAIVMAFLPVFADYIGLTKTHMGAMISVFIISAALMQYPAGILADKFSRIKIIFIGEILATICFAFFPLVSSFPHLLMVGAVAGLAGGLSMPAVLAINAEIGRDYGMASMMGLFDAAMGFGMLFGAITAGIVVSFTNIQTVFYYGVFMGAAALVAFALLSRKRPIG